jgi:uncharacterized HhH-GPD family protein
MARTTAHRTSPHPHLWLTDEPDHCALLAARPEAFVIGFILDQQVTVQKAFRAPADLLERIGTIDARELAEYDTDALVEAFSQKPALHRFPAAMARRVQDAMRVIVAHYDGDASRIWREARDLEDVRARLAAVPGLGGHKGFSIVAVLARQCDVPLTGWEGDVPEWGTLGDVDSPEALKAYQQHKRAYKKRVREAAAAAADD